MISLQHFTYESLLCGIMILHYECFKDLSGMSSVWEMICLQHFTKLLCGENKLMMILWYICNILCTKVLCVGKNFIATITSFNDVVVINLLEYSSYRSWEGYHKLKMCTWCVVSDLYFQGLINLRVRGWLLVDCMW